MDFYDRLGQTDVSSLFWILSRARTVVRVLESAHVTFSGIVGNVVPVDVLQSVVSEKEKNKTKQKTKQKKNVVVEM